MAKDAPQPIRVVHIIARMNVGGPALEITSLMRGIDARSVNQTLLTGDCSPVEADFLATQSEELPHLRIRGLGRRISPLGDLSALFALVRYLRRVRPDIVHTHTAKAGVLGRLAVRLSGISAPVVHTFHGHLLQGYFGPFSTRMWIVVERALAKMTDVLVTVGQKIKDDLLAVGIGNPNQYRVIHSGVEIGELPDQGDVRRRLRIPDGEIVVSMLGRLVSIKRPDRLADVALLAKNAAPCFRFVVAGGGDGEPALRSRVESENLPITLLGWISNIEDVLAVSDIMILVSDNEGLPLSLLQAAAAGVPAVATRVGSVPELVIDGETGLLSEPDPESIFYQLRKLTDSQLRKALGNAAREHARDKFDTRAFLDLHQDLYEKLMQVEKNDSR